MCFLLLVSCFFSSRANNTEIQSPSHSEGNDTKRFFQVCIDTVYLPIYKLTEEGKHIFDKVLSAKHQNFIKFPQGTFGISEEMHTDTTLTIFFFDKKTNFFTQYGWASFKGIVYYKEQTFLIWDKISNESMAILFENSTHTKGFCEYADKLFVKADERIYWRFVKRDEVFHFMYNYPPSGIIEFDTDIFK